MSNNQVGVVYQQIIGDVVETSRIDFEEGGVDESVLEELRQAWQKKLSQLNVATFPWDPKSEPSTLMRASTVPSNGGVFPNIATSPPISRPQMPNGPRIKSEPGLEPSLSSLPPMPIQNLSNASIAQQRAAQNVEAYRQGNRAPMQANVGRQHVPQQPLQHQQHLLQQQQRHAHQQSQQHVQPHVQQQQQRPQHQPYPLMSPQQQPRPALSQSQGQVVDYKRAMAQNAQRAAETLKRNNGAGVQAQTDGAGDDIEGSVGVIKQHDTAGEEMQTDRFEIDDMIRTKIQAMGQKMEGGGLMVPLKQASTPASRRVLKASRFGASASPSASREESTMGIGAQHDGGDEDDDEDDDEDNDAVKLEELDEDAINSDLDDSDDGAGGDDDDDETNVHIMLCIYDKVQRVKNKWKCVMKDGVLTVNQKEYVFHKATGDFEW